MPLKRDNDEERRARLDRLVRQAGGSEPVHRPRSRDAAPPPVRFRETRQSTTG
jgi:hypothetical protein